VKVHNWRQEENEFFVTARFEIELPLGIILCGFQYYNCEGEETITFPYCEHKHTDSGATFREPVVTFRSDELKDHWHRLVLEVVRRFRKRNFTGARLNPQSALGFGLGNGSSLLNAKRSSDGGT
jgi:hypothetical protein